VAAGCGAPAAPVSAVAPDQDTQTRPGEAGYDLSGKLVGFSCPQLTDEFFSSMSDEFDRLFSSQGARYVALSADWNPASQVDNIENFVTMGADVLILFFVDESAATDALIKAREAGVYVIAVADVMKDPDAYDVCINVDQYESGVYGARLAADWIDQKYPDAAPGSIDMALLESTAIPGLNPRNDGLDSITGMTDKLNIYKYDLGADDTESAAMQYADQAFLEHPNTKAFLCFSAAMSLGADEVSMSNVADKDGFAVFGVDAIDAVLDRVGGSAAGGSLIRGVVKLGVGTPYTVSQIVTGEWADKLVDKVYHEECIVIDPSNYAQYYSSNFD